MLLHVLWVYICAVFLFISTEPFPLIYARGNLSRSTQYTSKNKATRHPPHQALLMQGKTFGNNMPYKPWLTLSILSTTRWGTFSMKDGLFILFNSRKILLDIGLAVGISHKWSLKKRSVFANKEESVEERRKKEEKQCLSCLLPPPTKDALYR